MKNTVFFIQINVVKLSFLFILLLFPLLNFAQQLGIYEFQNGNTAVTAQPAHAVFSSYTRHGDLRSTFASNFFNTSGWSTGALDTNEYLEFTITASPGYSLHLTRITFDCNRSASVNTNGEENGGPRNARIASNFEGDFNNSYYDFNPPGATSGDLSKSNYTWEFEKVITTTVGGSVTFRLYGWAAVKGTGTLRIDNVALYGSTIPQVSINEFHYANTSVTRTGFVEVTTPTDISSSDLANAALTLYNGAGAVYSSYQLSDFKFFEGSIYTNYRVYYLDISAGLEETGGMSLSFNTANNSSNLIQFLSYGGEITATGGPASGQRSTDVKVTESDANGPSNSIYLTQDANPIWVNAGNNRNSKGYINSEQNIDLPVELLFFRAKVVAKGVHLNWATATEKNNERFEIERSADETFDFKSIAVLKGNGNAHQTNNYEFVDSKPLAGTAYYRLKQVDFDATVTYSMILAINRKVVDIPLALYPNPAGNNLAVDLRDNKPVGEVQLHIINAVGNTVFQKIYLAIDFNNVINISTSDLPAGTYYLVLIKDGKKESKSFIKL